MKASPLLKPGLSLDRRSSASNTAIIAPVPLNARARLAKKLCLGALNCLQHGSLSLIEGENRYVFGQVDVQTQCQGEMRILSADVWTQIAFNGSLGFAEAYMTGDWDSPDLTAVIRVLALNIDLLNQAEDAWYASLLKPAQRLLHALNRNSAKQAKRNIAAHYDLGNDLFERFLDPLMMYSSAIYPSADSSLEQAAAFKLHRIARKLDLQPGDHLLEIGTGWGGMAIVAARDYGCQVTTTTLSQQQYDYTLAKINSLGLEDKITLLLSDYRALDGQYDKLVSIEMIEAVGHQYYDLYFKTLSQRLKPEGLALIQAITLPDNRYRRALKSVDFIQRYIFPGSCIPSLGALQASVSKTDLMMLNFEDIGQHYARTLAEWQRAFTLHQTQILSQGYSDTFCKMWTYYLSYCEGGFAERVISCVQLLYAKPLNRHPASYGLFEQHLQPTSALAQDSDS
jgi:cyclopropane-fatty-acyl-phospholipid synthase